MYDDDGFRSLTVVSVDPGPKVSDRHPAQSCMVHASTLTLCNKGILKCMRLRGSHGREVMNVERFDTP